MGEKPVAYNGLLPRQREIYDILESLGPSYRADVLAETKRRGSECIVHEDQVSTILFDLAEKGLVVKGPREPGAAKRGSVWSIKPAASPAALPTESLEDEGLAAALEREMEEVLVVGGPGFGDLDDGLNAVERALARGMATVERYHAKQHVLDRLAAMLPGRLGEELAAIAEDFGRFAPGDEAPPGDSLVPLIVEARGTLV